MSNLTRTRHLHGGMIGLVALIGLMVPGLSAPSAAHASEAATQQAPATTQKEPDPRADDKAHKEAKRLMQAVDGILKDAAKERNSARKLPSKDDYIITPIWTETKEDRENRIKELLDSALDIVTDVDLVEKQKELEARRKSIIELQDQIVALKEKRLNAPESSMLPGILVDTVETIDGKIADMEKRIVANKETIETTKDGIHQALAESGVKMSAEQLDLLLDSVLSGDLVRLVAAFQAAKMVDGQLADLMASAGDNLKAARKYFAMHAALFAMLVHAQNTAIDKIDSKYLPRLRAINGDIRNAERRSRDLLRGQNRPDQERALKANLRSQKLAKEVASYYRKYLLKQREELARARQKAVRDLRIADNTFDTVEASFELRALIKDAAASFEAIQKLEAPGFDQIFQNKDLRREFENLTRKLDVPTS